MYETWFYSLIISELKNKALYKYVRSHAFRGFPRASLTADSDFTFVTYPNQEHHLVR
jgi:hypothetical protein